MNVLLLQLDSKLDFPNLALMRLFGWHRRQGDRVELRQIENVSDLQPRLGDPAWGAAYGSLIFERSKPVAREAQRIYPGIVLGGTGWDFAGGLHVRNSVLPIGAESAEPDYDAYPGYEFSLGFAQRGCRFSCGFCVVPRKEGKVVSVAGLREIWRGGEHPKKIVLLDNDFFGNPHWRELIAEALEHGFAIAVIQGINARLLSDEQAEAIANVRWMAGDFSRRRVYTAWDDEDDERTFFRGMKRLTDRGISPDSIMVYMLIGYAEGETHADRDRRRAAIRAFGARPYPMAYVRDGELGAELRAFAGWCVQRKDEFVPWEQWKAARGNPRNLGVRSSSLLLFPEDA